MADNNTDLLVDFLSKKKVTLQVVVDMDPLPGGFDTPDSVTTIIQNILDNMIGHYNPTVTFISVNNMKDGRVVFRDLLDTLK